MQYECAPTAHCWNLKCFERETHSLFMHSAQPRAQAVSLPLPHVARWCLSVRLRMACCMWSGGQGRRTTQRDPSLMRLCSPMKPPFRRCGHAVFASLHLTYMVQTALWTVHERARAAGVTKYDGPALAGRHAGICSTHVTPCKPAPQVCVTRTAQQCCCAFASAAARSPPRRRHESSC